MHPVLKRWLDNNQDLESYAIVAFHDSFHDIYKVEQEDLCFHWNSYDLSNYYTSQLRTNYKVIPLENLPTELFEAFELEGWDLNYPINVDYD